MISLTGEGSHLAWGFNIVDLYPSLEFLLAIGIKLKLKKVLDQINTILGSIINEHKEKLKGNIEAVEEDLVDVLLRFQGSGTLKCSIENNYIKVVFRVNAYAIYFFLQTFHCNQALCRVIVGCYLGHVWLLF
jgi:hypothetical protein